MQVQRIHLISKNQPHQGWRVIPFNSYYEAHPSGLIRNKDTHKLIKGTTTRKNISKWKGHEIVYLLKPRPTSYSRAKVIASTFPELISQSRGNLKTGFVCFKDGNTKNCNVNNMFISHGKVRNYIYKLNDSYMTSKDLDEDINAFVKDNISKVVKSLARQKDNVSKEYKRYIIEKSNQQIRILNKTTKELSQFELVVKTVKKEHINEQKY